MYLVVQEAKCVFMLGPAQAECAVHVHGHEESVVDNDKPKKHKERSTMMMVVLYNAHVRSRVNISATSFSNDINCIMHIANEHNICTTVTIHETRARDSRVWTRQGEFNTLNFHHLPFLIKTQVRSGSMPTYLQTNLCSKNMLNTSLCDIPCWNPRRRELVVASGS